MHDHFQGPAIIRGAHLCNLSAFLLDLFVQTHASVVDGYFFLLYITIESQHNRKSLIMLHKKNNLTS